MVTNFSRRSTKMVKIIIGVAMLQITWKFGNIYQYMSNKCNQRIGPSHNYNTSKQFSKPSNVITEIL